MEEIKKELAEIKDILLKLLQLEHRKIELQYGWMNPKSDSTNQT